MKRERTSDSEITAKRPWKICAIFFSQRSQCQANFLTKIKQINSQSNLISMLNNVVLPHN